ncbi:hypothetical protein AVEN_115300-1 [Araneus ventricosus]|uniref:Uncharacterized protein n=1 Tax=Araneus ventricosus TaxID=182803 RepID=A0A4Y1ZY02_ARAVE|nr:hypothetical protein AVEN_115300-1 [Araneus ventricosus]
MCGCLLCFDAVQLIDDIVGKEMAFHIWRSGIKYVPDALVVRKSRNHPTVEIDHWGDRCLVVGRMEFRLSSRKKGRGAPPLQVRTKRGVGLRRGERKQPIRKSRRCFRFRQHRKELCDQL